LFTPLVKAFCTDLGVENGLDAIQVLGGHGFIKEHGVEQIVRDAKILCLYEGTNGIQAMDLVRRKLQLKGGAMAELFFNRVDATIAEIGADYDELAKPLAKALTELREATVAMRETFNSDPNHAGAGAVEFQRAFALVALGYYWLRMLKASEAHPDADFRKAKQATGRFFARRILPEVSGLLERVAQGADGMMDISIEELMVA
ncbi:MAG: acyl-CoA dehydrogenase, partial [Oceanococcaceae bacterium]